MSATLTPAEQVFLNRMAEHMAKGKSFEDAARAVLDDDQRISVFVLNSKDGPAVQKALAAEVYHDIRKVEAVSRALSAPDDDKSPVLLPVYLRKEPTTDPAFLAYVEASGFIPNPSVHYDVVAYHDRTAQQERARWPWHSTKPTRANKRLTLNCWNWHVIWLPDLLPKAGG